MYKERKRNICPSIRRLCTVCTIDIYASEVLSCFEFEVLRVQPHCFALYQLKAETNLPHDLKYRYNIYIYARHIHDIRDLVEMVRDFETLLIGDFKH